MLSRKKIATWLAAFTVAGGIACNESLGEEVKSLSSEFDSVQNTVDEAVWYDAYLKNCSMVPNTDEQMNVKNWRVECGERYSAIGYYLTKRALQIRQQKARGEYPPAPKTPMKNIYAFTA